MVQFDNTMRVLDNYGTLFRETYRDNNAAAGYDPAMPLMNDVTFDVESSGGTFTITFHLPDYWRYAEEGRGPGKMPPKGSLLKWMEWKRILPSPVQLSNGKTVLPTMESLEFLIRRKIGTFGTEGSHTWKMTEDELKDRLVRDVTEALTKDFKEYVREMTGAWKNN